MGSEGDNSQEVAVVSKVSIGHMVVVDDDGGSGWW